MTILVLETPFTTNAWSVPRGSSESERAINYIVQMDYFSEYMVQHYTQGKHVIGCNG